MINYIMARRQQFGQEITADEEEPPSLRGLPTISYVLKNSSLPEWKRILRKSVSSPDDLSLLFGLDSKQTREVCEKYPVLVNPYYLSLIKEREDPIYKQCIPSNQELMDFCGEEDPLNEEPEHQVRKNVPSLITHRYPDRVLFRVSNKCAMYCRFCTRKRKVGDPSKQPTWTEIQKALEYIKNHEEIRDVLLSGGDPFMLDDLLLDKLLSSVYEILKQRKNFMIRIGTRIPCVLPHRITPELCNVLKKYQPIYVNTHFNHPSELTEQSKQACAMLADAGIPLGCQTVLLKGVNDNSETMKELMQGLVSMRVKPYYIYQADPVKGTNHFRTKVEKGLEIYESLRGHISGLCVPSFVIDAPGGGGKVPILPNYLQGINEEGVLLKNYEGKLFFYPQVKSEDIQ
ncbi:MAG: KamA family radical SAM protein [archaeon]